MGAAASHGSTGWGTTRLEALMPQTLCPGCGLTPSPPGAEECPRCHEPFAVHASHKRKHLRLIDGRTVTPDAEPTEYGGNITSVPSAPAKQRNQAMRRTVTTRSSARTRSRLA